VAMELATGQLFIVKLFVIQPQLNLVTNKAMVHVATIQPATSRALDLIGLSGKFSFSLSEITSP